jgi:hypothetical protein
MAEKLRIFNGKSGSMIRPFFRKVVAGWSYRSRKVRIN